MSLKMGYVGSKTKSLGQILEIGKDTSEPQPSTSETQERHELCELWP